VRECTAPCRHVAWFALTIIRALQKKHHQQGGRHADALQKDDVTKSQVEGLLAHRVANGCDGLLLGNQRIRPAISHDI
jgi:hypothetical protein